VTILLIANPQAVDEEGDALHWATVVDLLHWLFFGGAEDSLEFHDMLPLTILSIHSEEKGSSRVELNEMVSSSLSAWVISSALLESLMNGNIWSVSCLRWHGT
jgi:hypothetical protein